MKKGKIIIVIILCGFIFFNCSDTKEEKLTKVLSEYSNIFDKAIESTDRKVICESLTKLDKLYKKNSYINNHYYFRARLLTKIEEYEKALESLMQGKSVVFDYYLATFYFKYGKKLAKQILQNLYSEYSSLSIESNNFSIISMKIIIEKLLDLNYQETIEILSQNKILMNNFEQQILHLTEAKKEELIDSVWPEM